MPDYNANVSSMPDQRYAPPGVATCPSCGSSVCC